MTAKTYLAVDMGASSGRHVVGHFDGKKLRLEEIYRFANGPIGMNNSFFWNLPGLWSDVLNGLRIAGARYSNSLGSVGVDTWGVDFGLFSSKGELLGNPYCYRDARTDGAIERAIEKVSRQEIFDQTGLQFMQFNSLFQLFVMKEMQSPVLDIADRFLMMPDIFHWLLSGLKSNEFTNATTSQCFDPRKKNWAFDLLDKFGLPTGLFRPTSPPGTILGKLQKSVQEETGLINARVVLPGTHDTASAVLAVPTTSAVGETDWAYISLGTWALMGLESADPVVNETVARLNFTNEGGAGSTTRLLKNICGLWLIQECRRNWNAQGKKNEKGEPLDWEDLNKMAASASPLISFINPDAREFLGPTNMPEAIRSFTEKSGQSVPVKEGEILRTILDSLAMRFRHVLGMCEQISGNKIKTIHIVGGGIQNRLLCQAAADATGCRVVAGPIEATAIGNIMMQAIAAGDVASIPEARALIRESFPVVEYEPQNTAIWDDAWPRFLNMIEKDDR